MTFPVAVFGALMLSMIANIILGVFWINAMERIRELEDRQRRYRAVTQPRVEETWPDEASLCRHGADWDECPVCRH